MKFIQNFVINMKGAKISILLLLFIWQFGHPSILQDNVEKMDLLNAMEFSSQKVSNSCSNHFQDFKTRLKMPKDLGNPDARWALKSEKS